MTDITPEEVKAKLDRGDELLLIDVRETGELHVCSLPDAQHIPMMQLFTGMIQPAATPEREIVVFCHHGIRSAEAASFLLQNGFENVASMAGGIDAWAARLDPTMKRY